MPQTKDFDAIPGNTGDQETHAWTEGGGFAAARQRATQFGGVCRTTFRGQNAVMLTGEEGMRRFADPRLVVRAGTKSPAEIGFVSDGVTPVVPILDGEAHLARKAALLRLMTPEALTSHLPIIDETIVRFVQRWEQAGQVDVRAGTTELAFSALSRVIMGSVGDALMAAAYAGFTQTVLGTANRAPDPKRAHEVREHMLGQYRRVVAEERGRPAGQRTTSMIGLLVDAGELTDAEIVAETQHLFVGSSGVPLVACSALGLIGLHPALVPRLRDELMPMGSPPTLTELRAASYLQTFIEEVLRSSPIINTQIGRAKTAFEVGGYQIPEGTLLVAALYATDRSADLYPEPDAFDPTRAERVARAAGQPVCPFSKAAPFAYVPFGPGDRRTGHRCLAEELVYTVLGLLLARTVRSHAWTLVEPEKIRSLPAPHMASEVKVLFRRDGA